MSAFSFEVPPVVKEAQALFSTKEFESISACYDEKTQRFIGMLMVDETGQSYLPVDDEKYEMLQSLTEAYNDALIRQEKRAFDFVESVVER